MILDKRDRNRQTIRLVAALLASLTAGCQTMDESGREVVGTAKLERKDGSAAGEATLFRTGDEVTLSLALTGWTPGSKSVLLGTDSECVQRLGGAEQGVLGAKSLPGLPQSFDQSRRADLPVAMVGEKGSGTLGAVLSLDAERILPQIIGNPGLSLLVSSANLSAAPSGPAGEDFACGTFETKAQINSRDRASS